MILIFLNVLHLWLPVWSITKNVTYTGKKTIYSIAESEMSCNYLVCEFLWWHGSTPMCLYWLSVWMICQLGRVEYWCHSRLLYGILIFSPMFNSTYCLYLDGLVLIEHFYSYIVRSFAEPNFLSECNIICLFLHFWG